MKKDVLIAVLVGFSIGVIAALGSIKLSILIKQTGQSQSIAVNLSITPQPIDQIEKPSSLVIENPQDSALVDSEDIEIKGKTTPQSLVVIQNDKQIQVIKLDDREDFSAKVDISEGGNNIYVTSYNSKGEGETANFNIFKSTDKL